MSLSDIISLVFSGVVAISTVVYAVLTYQLTSETRKMCEAQTEPKISLSIQPREEYIKLLDMIVENIGQGPAYRVKFEVNPDFEFVKGYFLSQLGFVKNGVAYFAPKQKIEFFLTNIAEGFNDKVNIEIKIKVTYSSKTGKRYEDEYIISFKELAGLISLESPKSKIAYALERSERDFDKISSCLDQLKETLRNKK
ncbi:MAG TPA: hypothetical protein PK404_05825 [Fervidobacterium sp.]|nr:hypothetical protein [Fervidobacterium sp.]HPP18187.1 hypothetical protein [Fervidobacterium sp.]